MPDDKQEKIDFPVHPGEKIIPRNIEDEMKSSYIDYSMSVIVGRALPDVRDGLKPVHRRILYTMKEMGLLHNRPYKKSARVVGDVLGKYHPHGDMAVYDAMVRMVQDFSLRHPLVDGQGNFGCFTGDTKIKLLDGTERSFEQLAKDFKPGEKFAVYSVDKDGKIAIGWAHDSRITRKKAEVIELTLDNERTIRCTPDHRFLLRNNTYKAAKDLTTQDSLMPGYFRTEPVKEELNEYLQILQPKTNTWEFVHRLSDQENLRLGLAKKFHTPFVRHHKNFNRLDNRPENMLNQAQFYNHKVVSIKTLKDHFDVWDITVDEYHNFLLADSVFVHNSIDGDPPAAHRYTEVRLAGIADELLADIDKETVDFGPNYDDSLTEPLVLPAKLPNLLVNGSSGIAVGMATNIPPHNLGEVCDAVVAVIDNPDLAATDLLKIVKGPDFPTAAFIMGRQGIKDYFETGRGSVRIRSKTEIEDIRGGKQAIIVTELPYQVNKASLLSTIADLVRDKKIEDISDLRDESDRDGIRMVIEIKREGNAQIVLNQLFKHTQMEVSFGVIMLALVDGKPKVLPLRDVLLNYIEHRKDVIVRRTKYELRRAEERAHILEGLRIAIDNLTKVIKIIRESKDVDTARAALMQEFGLSKIQAQAILDMRLHQLTGLERKQLEEEYLELIKLIAKLKSILADPKKVLAIVKEELSQLKERYADDRRTKITAAAAEFDIEDLIQKEDVVVTLSHAGYIKRLPVTTYRSQRRGGKGVTGMTTREEDFVEYLFVTSTHSHMLFFTNKGRVYWLKVYEIPEVGRAGKGKALVNLIQIASQQDERITAAVAVEDFEKQKGCFLTMATRGGTVKKTALEEFSNPRRGGIIAINLDQGDELIEVQLTDGKQQLIMATRQGMAIRFQEEEIRVIGRPGKGVRGMRLDKEDYVVGMEIVSPKDSILTAAENGFGKRTEVDEYRIQSRGGKGVINMKVTEKTGLIVGTKRVKEEDDIMLTTAQGQVVRMPAGSIREIGRNTQGVRLIRLAEGDKLAAMAYIVKEDEEEAAS